LTEAGQELAELNGEEADSLWDEIAIALDETDQSQKALWALDAVQDPFILASCLQRLAERRVDQGDGGEGVRLAQRSLERLDSMGRSIDRIDTQAGAAHAFARCGDVPAARNLASIVSLCT
jgi:hypothetical protein